MCYIGRFKPKKSHESSVLSSEVHKDKLSGLTHKVRRALIWGLSIYGLKCHFKLEN